MLSKQPSSGLCCCCCCKIVFILQVARACCWLFLLSCFDGENFCVFLIRHENENALVVDFASEKLLTLSFRSGENFSIGTDGWRNSFWRLILMTFQTVFPTMLLELFLCTLGTLKDLGQRQTFHLMAYSGRLSVAALEPGDFSRLKSCHKAGKTFSAHTHQPTEAHTHKSKQHFPALAALISLCLIPAFYYYYFFGWV